LTWSGRRSGEGAQGGAGCTACCASRAAGTQS
jgi:hypothetical protein